MSQVVTRKTAISDDKEKRTDSPVKDMKKKMAANAEKEKEKQPADKTEKQPEKNAKVDKHDKTDKIDNKADKNDNKAVKNDNKADKNDNKADKSDNKADKTEKPADKTKAADKSDKSEKSDKSKQAEKVPDKVSEKDKPSVSEKKADNKVEKNGVDNKKTDSKDKKESQEKKDDKLDKNAKARNGAEKPKHNGSKQNGQSNGAEDSDDEVLEIADDEFPELTYDEGSDAESPTPDSAPSRSYTRRSQVKATRTPETPQPAADKPAENAASDDSKDSKVLKMNDAPTDRKLRSADPEGKKDKDDKTPKKKEKENGDNDVEIIEVDDDEPRKPDTNYSKSRVKVSPYRRSGRLADLTACSNTANYTGNNTTMEMDITESSIAEEEALNESYLQGLRTIRGRKSYKPLKEMTIRHVSRSVKTTASVTAGGCGGESLSRPTAPVVGRKRKPEPDDRDVEVAVEAGEITNAVHGKRMRLLERIALPFRRSLPAAHMPARRNAEIVGINTDLPVTAPVGSPFDPETLKPEVSAPTVSASSATELPAISVTPATPDEKDGKRCIVM